MSGVYISYPFCNQKCSFCNFASDVGSPQSKIAYHKALLQEIRAQEWAWRPETVYFGGGTPSLMPRELLDQLMAAIPAGGLTEVTLECAPGTVTREAVEGWRQAGVNRVSLGVQSFVTKELRQTGRRHTAETVRRDVEMVRDAGIHDINLDLIAGLPGQTPASWEESLDCIERLDPPHVSVYIFEVDEDSRLGKEVLLGGVRYGAARVPAEEAVAELYERAVERLAAMGIERYEISNFSKPGHRSRHNLKYWLLEPYVGFGLDAHSFDGNRRWSNPDNLNAYLTRGRVQEVTVTDAAEEHFFVGLRLMDGIEPSTAEWARFAGPIDKWVRLGMLERGRERLRLAPQGVLLSNEIFQDFVNV